MGPSRRSFQRKGAKASPRGLTMIRKQPFRPRKPMYADKNQVDVLKKGLQVLSNDRSGDDQGASGGTGFDSTSRKAPMKVAVRVRPLNGRECTANAREIISVQGPNMLIFDPERQQNDFFFHNQKIKDVTARKFKNLKFAFDNVYDATATNQTIYDDIMKPLLTTLLSGFNCSVFAYGATGSGKTYTMLGSPGNPGLMNLTIHELYERLSAMETDYETGVQIAYFEVYNEQVRDLLNPTGKQLVIMEVGNGINIKDLSFHQPTSIEHLLDMVRQGNQHRSQHPTDHNAESSRSHAVLQVQIGMRERHKDISSSSRTCKLVMVDLAGSEKGCATGFSGQRFREGSSINKSLLALGKIMESLAMGKKTFSFRDSKLTRILKDSLGGNCRTVMIANVSPSDTLYDDTLNTLRYAQKAKKISCNATKNVITVQSCLTEYTRVVNEMSSKIQDLEKQLQEKDDIILAKEEEIQEKIDELYLQDGDIEELKKKVSEKDMLLLQRDARIKELELKLLAAEARTKDGTPREHPVGYSNHIIETFTKQTQTEEEYEVNLTYFEAQPSCETGVESADVVDLGTTVNIDCPMTMLPSGDATFVQNPPLYGAIETVDSTTETLIQCLKDVNNFENVSKFLSSVVTFNTSTRQKLEKSFQDIELKLDTFSKLKTLYSETADPRYEKALQKITRKLEQTVGNTSVFLKETKKYMRLLHGIDGIVPVQLTDSICGTECLVQVDEYVNLLIQQSMLKISRCENKSLCQLVGSLKGQLIRKEDLLKDFASLANKMLNNLKHYGHLAPAISDVYDKLVSSYCSPSLKFAKPSECSEEPLCSFLQSEVDQPTELSNQNSPKLQSKALWVKEIHEVQNRITNKLKCLQSRVPNSPEITDQLEGLLSLLSSTSDNGDETVDDLEALKLRSFTSNSTFTLDQDALDEYEKLFKTSALPDIPECADFELEEGIEFDEEEYDRVVKKFEEIDSSPSKHENQVQIPVSTLADVDPSLIENEIKENEDPLVDQNVQESIPVPPLSNLLSLKTVQENVEKFSRQDGAPDSSPRSLGVLRKPTQYSSPVISPQEPGTHPPEGFTTGLRLPATGPRSVSPKKANQPVLSRAASSTGKAPSSFKIKAGQRSPYSKSKHTATSSSKLFTGPSTFRKVVNPKPKTEGNSTSQQKGLPQRQLQKPNGNPKGSTGTR